MRKDLGILALLVLLAVGYFWPVVLHPDSRISNDYDGVLISWILHQVTGKVLAGDVAHLFSGPIFYPEPYTLNYSDIFLTHVLMALPLRLVSPEPIALFNFTLLSGFTLTLVMLYFLLHEVSDNRMMAAVGAVAFSFSPLYLHYLGHLQMIALEFVPLALLALVKISQRKSKAWIAVWWFSLVAQTANSFLPGMFIVFCTLGLLAGWPTLRKMVWRHWRWHLGGLVASMGVLFPIILPYLTVNRLYHYARPITDVVHFSLSPEEILTTYASYGIWVLFVCILLLSNKNDRFLKLIWFGGWGALVMALGPALHWMGRTVKISGLHIPLPYVFFYYVMPGFKAFRTPSRWLVLAGLLWVVAGTAAAARLRKQWRLPVVLLVLALTAWQLPRFAPGAVPTWDEYPRVYSWLSKQQGEVVVELPIFRWGSDDFSKHEVYRMLYHLKSGKQLINGYSGFSTPEWEQLVARVYQTFPSAESIQLLKDRGADYIIVDRAEYAALGKTIPENIPGVTRIATFGDQAVYRY